MLVSLFDFFDAYERRFQMYFCVFSAPLTSWDSCIFFVWVKTSFFEIENMFKLWANKFGFYASKLTSLSLQVNKGASTQKLLSSFKQVFLLSIHEAHLLFSLNPSPFQGSCRGCMPLLPTDRSSAWVGLHAGSRCFPSLCKQHPFTGW